MAWIQVPCSHKNGYRPQHADTINVHKMLKQSSNWAQDNHFINSAKKIMYIKHLFIKSEISSVQNSNTAFIQNGINYIHLLLISDEAWRQKIRQTHANRLLETHIMLQTTLAVMCCECQNNRGNIIWWVILNWCLESIYFRVPPWRWHQRKNNEVHFQQDEVLVKTTEKSMWPL
jgi:hypothetical protein